MGRYIRKTYGEYRFYIEGGSYSIEELEELVKELKEQRRAMKEAVKLSMDELHRAYLKANKE